MADYELNTRGGRTIINGNVADWDYTDPIIRLKNCRKLVLQASAKSLSTAPRSFTMDGRLAMVPGFDASIHIQSAIATAADKIISHNLSLCIAAGSVNGLSSLSMYCMRKNPPEFTVYLIDPWNDKDYKKQERSRAYVSDLSPSRFFSKSCARCAAPRGFGHAANFSHFEACNSCNTLTGSGDVEGACGARGEGENYFPQARFLFPVIRGFGNI